MRSRLPEQSEQEPDFKVDELDQDLLEDRWMARDSHADHPHALFLVTACGMLRIQAWKRLEADAGELVPAVATVIAGEVDIAEFQTG